MAVSTLPELDLQQLKPPLAPYIVRDAEGLSRLKDFFSRVTVFGFDTETNLTETFVDRKIRVIQVGDRQEQYVIDLLAFAGSESRLMEQGNMTAPEWAVPVAEVLKTALDSNKWLKVGVYLQFDYEVLFWCLGVRSWNFYDCNLAEKALNAGKVNFFTEGYYSMGGMCQRYLGFSIDKTLQTSFNLSDTLTEGQVTYAALDTRIPLAIMKAQSLHIAANKLEKCVQIENDAIPAFGDMHLYGFKLDEGRWMALNTNNKQKHAENIKAMDGFFLNIVGSKYKELADLAPLEAAWKSERDREKRVELRKAYQAAAKETRKLKEAFNSFQGEAAINYEAPGQIITALRKAGFSQKKLPSTDNQVLKKLAVDNPIIKALIDYRESSIRLKTFGETFIIKYVNPTTKRIHSDVDQYGAETGRTSSSKPNIQNIPKEAEWRRCFVPEPGWVLITSDYNGCELRILAEVSGEKVWIDAFNNGWDVHSVGAEILFGKEWQDAAEEGCAYYKAHQKCKCKKHKELRDKVKAMNFGIAYGMEAKKLANDLGISRAEAQELLERYRATFKKVTAWLNKAGNMAKMQLMCRTLSGRIRFFLRPDWDRAREIATKRAKEDNKGLTPEMINQAYYGLYGNIEREGKNTPIQGTNADMVKRAVGCGFDDEGRPYLWHILRELGVKMVNIVHDEIVVESLAAIAEQVQELTGSCMVRAGAEFVKSVRMTYESLIAEEWSKG